MMPRRQKKTRVGRNFQMRRTSRGKRGAAFKIGTVGTIAAVIAAAGLAANEVMDIERADANFCFVRDDQTQVAVLIDNSVKGHTAQQLRDYETGLLASYAQAPANARIKFFTTALDGQGSIARPVLTICKPAETPAEREAMAAPSKPAPYLKRQAEEARDRYRAAIADVLAATQDQDRVALDSPILELVQAVSRYDGFQGRARSLVLVTDGIQNSETAEFCVKKGHMPRFERFAERPGYAFVKPRPLTGVDITLLLVEYGKLPSGPLRYCTNAELRTWWPDYFKGNGAHSVELYRLRTGAGS